MVGMIRNYSDFLLSQGFGVMPYPQQIRVQLNGNMKKNLEYGYHFIF